MILGETFRVALSSIRANKLRSSLTMLGIVIGVGAVIAVVALGTGAQRAVEAQINSMGANVISVWQDRWGRRLPNGQTPQIVLSDAEALARDAKLMTNVVPEMSQNKMVELAQLNMNMGIVGTTPAFVPVKNYKLLHGRMFTEGEMESRQRYAVLGFSVPEKLEQNSAAIIGRMITIAGQPFEVIGVFQEKGAAMSWQNPDEQIIIPLNTARYRTFGTEELSGISLQVNEKYSLEQGMVEAEHIMRREHKVQPGGQNDFRLGNRRDLLSTQQQTTEIFTTLLASIAAVSLAVGGIGIMNIMLVSVTERTKEIGIRRALGATKLTIMSQFLVEAVVLCLMGGVFGIVAGALSAEAMKKFLGYTTFVDPMATAISLAFSAFVGLFFGLWPARRAANLNTIDALRYE